MRALLYKDLVVTWKYSKSLLGMVLLFSIIGAVKPDVAFFEIYGPLVLTALSLNALAYDEKFGWLKYADALPYGRKTVVRSKYVLSLVGCLVGVAVGLLCTLVAGLIQGDLSLAAMAVIAVSGMAAGTLNVTLMMPVAFRFDTNKARVVFIIIVAVVFAMVSQLFVVPDLVRLTQVDMTWLALGVLGVCLVLWIAGYNLSLLFYRNKRL